MRQLKKVIPALCAYGLVGAVAWYFLWSSPKAAPQRRVVKPGANAQLTGHVRLGQSPGVGLRVVLSQTDRADGDVVVTDKDGRFQTGLLLAGEYTARIQTTETMPSTTRYVTLVDGVNESTLDLPPTRLDLVFDRGAVAREDDVQVMVQGPVSPTGSSLLGLVRKASGGGATLIGIGYGDYLVTAFSQHATSVRPVKVTLTPGHASATEQITLEHRVLKASVKDLAGRLIPSARLQASVLQVNTPGDDGLFDISGFPSGIPLYVKASGFLPACVTTAESGMQDLQLRALGTHSLSLTLIAPPEVPTNQAPRSVVGFLAGLPGSDCPVSVRELRVRDVPGGPRRVGAVIYGLPAGEFTFRVEAQAAPMTVRIPGPDAVYAVPSVCRLCS